jgi:hypothetical protein
MTPQYLISQFDWDKSTQTFSALESTLYPVFPANYYKIPFPNSKRQFIITNPKTGGFRRFRFWKEILNKKEHSCIYRFKSEDSIICNITKV